VNRIAERSGRYRWEGHGFYSVIVRDADGLAVATGERFGLVPSASSIHWANGVNYIFGGQSSAGGDDSFAGGERTDFRNDALALLEDRGAASMVNRSIHAPATEQRRVRGVNDSFGSLLGDVGGAVEFERLAVRERQSGCEVGNGDRCQVSQALALSI
jgi:hypothetical protein